MTAREDATIINSLVRQALISAQEVMGDNGLNTVLRTCGLERFVGNFPPNNLEPFWMGFTPNRAFKKKPRLIARAKDKNDTTRLMGFGHRVYKNYDPRAAILKRHCDEVLKRVGVSNRWRTKKSCPSSRGPRRAGRTPTSV